VLVTGGAGFVGSHIVDALRAAGQDVRVLDVRTGADIRDADAVERALDGVDHVCHQAGMVGLGVDFLDVGAYVSHNDLGTAVLLRALARRRFRGRLVLASSMVVYGEGHYRCATHGPVRPQPRRAADLDAGRFEPRCPACGAEVVASAVEEDDPLDPPRNVYAVSKLAQEYLVGSWTRETGGQAVALRYHNVYGPGMPYESPYSGVASTFRSFVARGEAPQVFEDGGPRRDFVHVSDVAAASLAALTWREKAGFRAFNVASGQPRSIGELAAALAHAAGAPEPVITGRYRVGDVRHIFASPKRLIAELGWRPAVDFATGTAEFANAPMRGLDVVAAR